MKVFSEESALQLTEMLLQNDKDIKTELESKIDSINVSGGEYDDTELVERIETLEEEIEDKASKSDIPSVEGLATETFVTNAIANAELGGGDTEVDLSGFATKDDLKGYASKEHEHDEYLTEHQDLSDYALKTEIPTDYLSSIPDEYVTTEEMTEAINNAKLDGESVDLSDYAKKTDIPDTSNFVEKEDGKGLFSGSYDDLTDKPNIPEAYDDTALVEMIEGVETSLGDKADKTELHTHVNKEVLDSITSDKVTSWDSKATEAFVTNAIAQARLDGSDVDLSGLVTKDELNAKADKDHNHDDKYQPIGNYLTEHQDISEKSDIDHKHVMSDITDYITPDLSGYALKTEIPSVDSLVSEDVLNTTLADYAKNDITLNTKVLIDTLYARNMKNNFAFRDMPKAQCVLILDDCLPSVITTCVNNAIAKNVPLNMGAISEHFNTLTKQETETVLEAIKRGIANGGEVLLHGDGTINETNINDEEYLKQKFLDEKEIFIENGLNPRGVIVVGGGDEIYGDIRTDRWVRALFDYSDGYGTSEPYYHRRYAPTTLEQAKEYIDSAVANKSFCPIFAHKWYDFWDEMIDYAVSKGAVWTTYANVYDTYGTTTSVKALENRLKALESASGNVKTLVSISATKTKTTYNVNDTLGTDDITVIATYSDESTADVTFDAAIDISNVVMSAAGSYEITVSYSGKTTTITITVEESQTGTETVIYQVDSIEGTCDGTKDAKVGDSSTSWTEGKQYRYVFDYEITEVQDAETTVELRDVNSTSFEFEGSMGGLRFDNATVGESGHLECIIYNNNTRQRQAFTLRSYDKTYTVTFRNVVITELS